MVRRQFLPVGLIALILLIAAPFPAFAQYNGVGANGLPAPSDISVRALPEWTERPITEECGKGFGCLVIINTSDNFDLIDLYLGVQNPDGDGEWSWSNSQFRGRGLRPHKAMFLARSGDELLCDVRVRVVMRSRTSKEEVRASLGSVSLCRRDGTDNIVLPIKVLQPQVILEDGDGSASEPPPSASPPSESPLTP